MGEACGGRGADSVRFKEEESSNIVLQKYSGMDVMEKQRGMSRGLNNFLDISSDSALPNQVLALPLYRVR